MAFKYRDTVLKELARHGVIPRDDTHPELIHEFINKMYLFEIRALRQRLLSVETPKADYAKHVDELRRRYPILSLPVRFWTEPE